MKSNKKREVVIPTDTIGKLILSLSTLPVWDLKVEFPLPGGKKRDPHWWK